MTEEEDFVVEEPYQPNEEEKQAIAELEKRGIVAEDWDSRKKHIESFKKNLRDDIYKKQNKLCAFCRIHVPEGCVPMHREHIVYKDAHPQWMFLPENLCIACPSCNEYKGTTEVLVDTQTETYPRSGNGFKIIHPMYDRYSDHIELVDEILYRGKTDKGAFTINTCHLYRVELAEERVYQRMRSQDKEGFVSGILQLLSQSEQYVDNNEAFVGHVKDVVNEYKKKQSGERSCAK